MRHDQLLDESMAKSDTEHSCSPDIRSTPRDEETSKDSATPRVDAKGRPLTKRVDETSKAVRLG